MCNSSQESDRGPYHFEPLTRMLPCHPSVSPRSACPNPAMRDLVSSWSGQTLTNKCQSFSAKDIIPGSVSQCDGPSTGDTCERCITVNAGVFIYAYQVPCTAHAFADLKLCHYPCDMRAALTTTLSNLSISVVMPLRTVPSIRHLQHWLQRARHFQHLLRAWS